MSISLKFGEVCTFLKYFKSKAKTNYWRKFPYCKLIIVDLSADLTPYFASKIHLRKNPLRNNLLYVCGNWKKLITEKPYVIFTPEYLNTWGSLILIRLNNVKQLAISDYLLQCNSTTDFDDIHILAAYSNKFKLVLRKCLLIKRDKPILNSTIKSFLL